jgi:hypothetical protein
MYNATVYSHERRRQCGDEGRCIMCPTYGRYR